MTEPTTTDIRQLLQEGRAAALAGDSFAARTSFRRATEIAPESAEAWIGLSSVTPVLAEKSDYLRKAVALEPDNQEASASLVYVEKLMADGLRLAPSQRRAAREAPAEFPLPIPTTPETPTEITYCYRHPDRETGLHCVQCNRPICSQCAQVAAVGQLCPECRRGRTPRNYQVSATDMLIGGVVGLLALGIVSYPFLLFGRGFFAIFIVIFVAPLVAELVIRINDRLTRAKRGRRMQVAVGVGMAIGAAPWLLLTWNLFLLGFVVLAIVTAVARLR